MICEVWFWSQRAALVWDDILKCLKAAGVIIVLILFVSIVREIAGWWHEIRRPRCAICGRKRSDDRFLTCSRCGKLFCPEYRDTSHRISVGRYDAFVETEIRYSCGVEIKDISGKISRFCDRCRRVS